MLASIIFDLDGTLIDSSEGILGGLSKAFSNTGVSGVKPIDPSLIGPPLQETLEFLCPNASKALLTQLLDSFKAYYDTVGWQQSTPYPGVADMLHALADAKIPLHIATNKRQRPTLQILEALGWADLFDQVFSPDSFNPPLPSKAAILTQLLTENNLSATDCLYIGDRFDDYNAAKEIGISFALANWGFEQDEAVFHSGIIRLETPNANELMTTFRQRQQG